MAKVLLPLFLLPALLALPAAAAAGATGGSDAPRLDVSSPIVGGRAEAIVDRLAPGAGVVLEFRSGSTSTSFRGVADTSGCASFSWDVPAELVGEDGADPAWSATATVDEPGRPLATTPAVAIPYQYPQLLVTGLLDGRAVLSRIEVRGGGSAPFGRVRSVDLGPSGGPGGAVRDGRGTRTFVVSDALHGVLSMVPDEEHGGGPVRQLVLPGAIRGIARTPDGSRILVTSAASPTESSLSILDACAADPAGLLLARIPLEPLGAQGGRIVISGSGLKAFVAVQGLLLREIDLLHNRKGNLIAVAGPGQDEIRDLRIVDGFLFVLTGRSDRVNYVVGLEVDDLGNVALEGPTYNGPRLGVAKSGGRPSLLLLNGDGGEVTVVDAEVKNRTMRRRGNPNPVTLGADELLLTPDPDRTDGALLFGRLPDPQVRGLEFDRFTVGEPVRLGLQAPVTAVPVYGSSRLIDLSFVADAAGRIYALDPDGIGAGALVPQPLPLDERLEAAVVAVE